MQYSKHYFDLKGKNAEGFVHDLALHTFFTDWCYLKPSRPDGKELCDLLVIFDDIAVIWQIKDLKLDKDVKYKKAEVEKNLRQLAGARRHLFDLKTIIELKNPRRGIEAFDATVIREIHLISAPVGEGEEYFSPVESIKDYTAHVFTRDFTRIILNELDTVSDFIKYLQSKEALIKLNKRLIVFGGEEELLAYYLYNGKSFEKLKDATDIFIEEGSWEKLKNSNRYKKKKEADRISYGWDGIINRIHEGSGGYEKIARELARPNRFQRRVLSKRYDEAFVKADKDTTGNTFRRFFIFDGITYCFLFFDKKMPRENRKTELMGTCYIARGVFKNVKVIGIATEKQASGICSYDVVFMDLPTWTKEDREVMEKTQKETGILLNPATNEMNEDEYPCK